MECINLTNSVKSFLHELTNELRTVSPCTYSILCLFVFIRRFRSQNVIKIRGEL